MCVLIQSLWVHLSLSHADLEDSLTFINSENIAYSQDQESQLTLLQFLDTYWCVLLGVKTSNETLFTTFSLILLLYVLWSSFGSENRSKSWAREALSISVLMGLTFPLWAADHGSRRKGGTQCDFTVGCYSKNSQVNVTGVSALAFFKLSPNILQSAET